MRCQFTPPRFMREHIFLWPYECPNEAEVERIEGPSVQHKTSQGGSIHLKPVEHLKHCAHHRMVSEKPQDYFSRYKGGVSAYREEFETVSTP